MVVSECSAGNQAVLRKTVSSLLCYILHRLNGFTRLKPATTIVSTCVHKWVDNFRNSAHQRNHVPTHDMSDHPPSILLRQLISRSELCKRTEERVLFRCGMSSRLIVPVGNGSAPVNGIPTALKTEPQQAMESFLDVWLCPVPD